MGFVRNVKEGIRRLWRIGLVLDDDREGRDPEGCTCRLRGLSCQDDANNDIGTAYLA